MEREAMLAAVLQLVRCERSDKSHLRPRLRSQSLHKERIDEFSDHQIGT